LVVPGAVLPLLPNATCPVCLAGYVGIFSSLGVGVVLTGRTEKPLILFFLGVSLASVAWAAGRRRRFGPLLLVILGSVAIVAARIVWQLPLITYCGVTLLLAAAVWNFRCRRMAIRSA